MGFDSKKIGNRMAELRKTLKHVSQEKMAEDLGMYQPDISALENGKLGSGIADLNKLSLAADYLGVSLNRILGCCEEDTSVIIWIRSKIRFKIFAGSSYMTLLIYSHRLLTRASAITDLSCKVNVINR